MSNVINIKQTDRHRAAEKLIDIVGEEHRLAVMAAMSVAYVDGVNDQTPKGAA